MVWLRLRCNWNQPLHIWKLYMCLTGLLILRDNVAISELLAQDSHSILGWRAWSGSLHAVGYLLTGFVPSRILGCLIKQIGIRGVIVHVLSHHLSQSSVELGHSTGMLKQCIPQWSRALQVLDADTGATRIFCFLKPWMDQPGILLRSWFITVVLLTIDRKMIP